MSLGHTPSQGYWPPIGWSDQTPKCSLEKNITKCSLIVVTIRSINVSCFMCLSEILSKLQTFKVTDFMKFSSDAVTVC